MRTRQYSTIDEGARVASEYVIYSADSYAGFFRRLVAIVVDVFLFLPIATVLIMAVRWLCWAIWTAPLSPLWELILIWTMGYLYMTAIKRSRFTTVGYRVAGIRIVDLKGQRPSMLRMTARLVIWVSGPVHPLVDLLFVSNDEQRRAIRDMLVGTCVIRKGALPTGSGRLLSGRLGFMGLMFVYPVVRPVHDEVGTGALERTSKESGLAPEPIT